MSELRRSGVRVTVPPGWEGVLSGEPPSRGRAEERRGKARFLAQADERQQARVLHVGSFPLPADRGSFGSGAVELMRAHDVLIVLFEHDPESANSPLFATQGIPRRLDPQLFDREALQQVIPGQSGLQHFFTHNDRAFCLYVVLGSHIDRVELVERVNAVLETLEIE
ncbi:MAG: hypothetical protein ACRDVL_13515 [Acidimicrobiia bacterium]